MCPGYFLNQKPMAQTHSAWMFGSMSRYRWANTLGIINLSEGRGECRLDSPIDKLFKKLSKLRSSLSDFLGFASSTQSRTLAQG